MCACLGTASDLDTKVHASSLRHLEKFCLFCLATIPYVVTENVSFHCLEHKTYLNFGKYSLGNFGLQKITFSKQLGGWIDGWTERRDKILKNGVYFMSTC